MILVTGGIGYLGAHCVISLLEQQHKIIVIDNLVNSSMSTIKKIEKITKKNFIFYQGDIRDYDLVNKIFQEHPICSVMHFAGLKSIVESFEIPDEYFSVNIGGSINLIEAMKRNKVYNLIFSSSATVYSSKNPSPWKECMSVDVPQSPYATSKYIVENLLKNLAKNCDNFSIGSLRYFNPIGAHDSGLLGEKIESNKNLIPAIMDFLTGKKKYLSVYGNDYDTFDGSGIRDYVHVNDLILGHIKALNFLDFNKGYHIWNFGSGKGYSVFQVIKVFEKFIDRSINIKVEPRRKGDIAQYWSDISKAEKQLSWKPSHSIDDMVKDTLKYLRK